MPLGDVGSVKIARFKLVVLKIPLEGAVLGHVWRRLMVLTMSIRGCKYGTYFMVFDVTEDDGLDDAAGEYKHNIFVLMYVFW